MQVQKNHRYMNAWVYDCKVWHINGGMGIHDHECKYGYMTMWYNSQCYSFYRNTTKDYFKLFFWFMITIEHDH